MQLQLQEPDVTSIATCSACRKLGVAFYTASSRGSTSFLFADLASHTYTPQVW